MEIARHWNLVAVMPRQYPSERSGSDGRTSELRASSSYAGDPDFSDVASSDGRRPGTSLALSLARTGQTARAQEFADSLNHDYPLRTEIQNYPLPTIWRSTIHSNFHKQLLRHQGGAWQDRPPRQMPRKPRHAETFCALRTHKNSSRHKQSQNGNSC